MLQRSLRRRPYSCRSSRYPHRFGQPVHETHPHLLAAGELTPGIPAVEYHHRRSALAKKLPANSIAILKASELRFKSGPAFYEFHQDPNFFHLTGFNEPSAVAAISTGTSPAEYTFHLFVRPKDVKAEQWDGARSGIQAALDVFNADEAWNVADVHSILPDLVKSAKCVYTDLGEKELVPLVRAGKVRQLRNVMDELRVYKSEAELECMRKAASVSGEVLRQVMQRSFATEKLLWADLAYGFKTNGLDGEAYVPVVAGGRNALCIHYVRNDDVLRQGDVVLVDAGGEYGGYITDITRTWAVDGKFSPAQRDLYDAVLRVQESCISLCREDVAMSLDEIHSIASAGLREGLKDLGFDNADKIINTVFPHHVGHHIGLEVHDAATWPRTKKLEQNQCVTIEPGLYVPDDDRFPAHFRGLGIRIEDSIHIGRDKPEVLTHTAPK
ncbi:peptidase M24 [Piedraia hortae CBS 480.64]|uniref:Xaa-Pro aminopeptidase n=1 Tax=Piedraia hortae CBS 480.64 TaxID=1314780 RepID=A0A6A7BQK0_9PEZI|nr:peptidase M24 [Piedraia hortae CBS 480.64]